MTDALDDGGPAFPVDYVPGMTLRQHYAGLAMQALIWRVGAGAQDLGQEAYAAADEMLAFERAEREGGNRE